MMQTKPDYLDQLIERAAKEAGSEYKLAQRIGVPRQNLSAWKNGRKPCPAADVALMAEIAGLEAEAWVCRAVVEQYAGTEKGEALKNALKKALVATGAGLISCGAIAAEPVGYFIRCILC